MQPIPKKTEEIAKEIVDAAFKVHSALGAGLLEMVYETCLAHEFEKRGMAFQRQCKLPIIYDGVTIDAGLRLDLKVEESVIVELKAVEKVIPLYKAQILTYLKLSGLWLGFLINFNVPLIKNGIDRIIL